MSKDKNNYDDFIEAVQIENNYKGIDFKYNKYYLNNEYQDNTEYVNYVKAILRVSELFYTSDLETTLRTLRKITLSQFIDELIDLRTNTRYCVYGDDEDGKKEISQCKTKDEAISKAIQALNTTSNHVVIYELYRGAYVIILTAHRHR